MNQAKSSSASASSGPRPRKKRSAKAFEQLSDPSKAMDNLSRQSQWLVLAVGSGACAAFNGVFAKLTTTELTSSWAHAISSSLGLAESNKATEFIIRAMFFGLNLLFNGIMWALFTTALAKGTSTTQVSIVNTSSNFMITAIMGWLIFSETLPPLWWVGAALLVAGNVVIGRREEKEGAAREGAIALGEDEQGEALTPVNSSRSRNEPARFGEAESLTGKKESTEAGDEIDNPL